jgi:hypothetical protein
MDSTNLSAALVAKSRQVVPLFLHIPKTAGTTLSNCIYQQYTNGLNVPAEVRAGRGYLCEWLREGVFYYPTGFFKPKKPVVPQWVRHALARDDINAIIGHFPFGIHRFVPKPTTYVTLIREPVDRVVSLYYHLTPDNITLDEFVSSLQLRETDNDQTRRIAGLEPPFGRCTEKLLARAKDNLVRHFSVVGVAHRFEETLVLIKRALNWRDLYVRFAVLSLFDLVNRDRPPRSEIPTATVDRIAAHNRFDEELFRFAEMLLDEAIAAQGPGFADELQAFKAWNAQRIDRWTARGASPPGGAQFSKGSRRQTLGRGVE